jgi:hypothetical protein
MRKLTVVASSVVGLALVLGGFAAAEEKKAEAASGSWKGEIVDVACYVPMGAKSAGHADCAKKCAKAGQPIGLLTGDGDLLLLVADHTNGKPFEAAREAAGGMAEVSGKLSERNGAKVVTVTAVKPVA